jgi:solute carrier family 25 S-adenosylmethionine transporter 26
MSMTAGDPLMPNTSAPLAACLLAGGIAGMAVDMVLFPLDTIKTRLQSAQGLSLSGGFQKIYSGIAPTLLVSAPNAAIFFFTYEALFRAIQYSSDKNEKGANQLKCPMIASLLASSGAEFAACSIRVPGEVIKQKRQVSQYPNTMLAIKSIYQRGGLLAFYQGFLPTIARDIPFVCIQFPIYEALKVLLLSRKKRSIDVNGNNGSVHIKPWESACCGSIAGGIAALCTTPFDVLKTRTMLFQASYNGIEKISVPSMIELVKSIIPKEGISKLWAGVVPRVTSITLGGFIYFGAYEKAKHILSPLDHGKS